MVRAPASPDRPPARESETCASCPQSSRVRSGRFGASPETWSCAAAPQRFPRSPTRLLSSRRRLPPRFLALAAAALDQCAVPAGALLDHAAESVGAELEVRLASGTARRPAVGDQRSEEHTSELQSLTDIS